MITFTLVCLSLFLVVASAFILTLGGAVAMTHRAENPLGRAIVEALDSARGRLDQARAEAVFTRQARLSLLYDQSDFLRTQERLTSLRAEILDQAIQDGADAEIEAESGDDDEGDDEGCESDESGDPICDQCFTHRVCPTPETCRSEPPQGGLLPRGDSSPSRQRSLILVSGAADGVLQ